MIYFCFRLVMHGRIFTASCEKNLKQYEKCNILWVIMWYKRYILSSCSWSKMRRYSDTNAGSAYSYNCHQNSRKPREEDDSLEIRLRCPRISSFGWCLKLYSLVLGGLGLFLSFFWVCFQLYVLSQTNNYELRLQRWDEKHYILLSLKNGLIRYLDIFLGLLLFLSLICLLYGGYSESQIWIITFIIISLGVVLSYWGSYLYNNHVGGDYSDYEEQVTMEI